MQIRFLLGPAGSGKTFRCLSEIRAALSRPGEGAPLILLAPKQATFQLERQLLADENLSGYTRLQILSFERLAKFVFDQLGRPVPRLIAEEGRTMVLRALLEQKRSGLRLLRASARLPGFVRQLSELLRELQQCHLTPARLEALAERAGEKKHLQDRLHDLASILRAYTDWLKQHQLEDADRLLDLATEALTQPAGNPSAEKKSARLELAGVWLDGFAQMTPQERQLVAAVAARAEQSTLAFCLDDEPAPALPWHSTWGVVAETFRRCRDELGALPGAKVEIETLERQPGHGRFAYQPALQHLEKNWAKPGELAMDYSAAVNAAKSAGVAFADAALPVRVVAAANPDAEAEFVAREIRRYVREYGGRFRDVAVLLRTLESYHDAIRRVFVRYEIPFFLDRREAVAHHPLAELTRYALRLAVYGWEHDDWFGALKTGLAHDDDAAVDRLENEALARGWRGRAFWLEPIQIANAPEGDWVERIRHKIVPPFQAWIETVAAGPGRPNGAQLAAAIRALWRALKVDRKLERWSSRADELVPPDASALRPPPSAIHETVWEQMVAWLENLELAFSTEALSLADWLPVIESGLGQLSVGVIPPALDQVLVGAIDRSRNPDLQIAFLLGVNEGVFPAPPPAPALLNRADRETLAALDAAIGPDHHQQIGLERYYGYIACTRARRQLVATYAQRDSRNHELNPSPFIADLQRIFPGLIVEEFSDAPAWPAAEHWTELIVPALRGDCPALAVVPGLEPLLSRWREMTERREDAKLPARLVESLYGMDLRTSVSGLEDFASCPFKFFAGRGLRAEERLEFTVDPREKGSFQHDVLKEFHLQLEHDGKRWRDLSPAEAGTRVRAVGESLLPRFRDGLFLAGESQRFTARLLIEGLERLVGTLVSWAKQYQFDPAAVETGFGLKESSLPAWRIDLDGTHALLLRGRIDRVDVCRIAETGEALGVVIDYKSSARQLDPVLLHHGLELQLLAYLAALGQFTALDQTLKVPRLVPAGAFYVALKGSGSSAKTRDEERDGRAGARTNGFQHRGRFDGGRLERFDSRGERKGDQFRFSKKQDGTFANRGNEALATADFRALVTQVEEFLRQHGRAVYAGSVEVWPYRWKMETACDFCHYRPVCRFDPWQQPYRLLRSPDEPSAPAQPAAPPKARA